jgi:cytochrome oxidase Cu insertion factor (SCO1/SenC/PrrC family)
MRVNPAKEAVRIHPLAPGLLTLLILLVSLPPVTAQDKNAAANQPGLVIGAQAPDFTLKDQNGQDQSLQTLLKNGPVALVFHRSADW